MGRLNTIEDIEARAIPVPFSGCLIWMGAAQKAGYGNVRWQRRFRRVHAVMYEYYVGPIPDGMELDHLCRVPACINPLHLEPVTHYENLVRCGAMELIGPQRRALTHCKQGHEFTLENTGLNKSWRYCRTCNAACSRETRRRAALRAAGFPAPFGKGVDLNAATVV